MLKKRSLVLLLLLLGSSIVVFWSLRTNTIYFRYSQIGYPISSTKSAAVISSGPISRISLLRGDEVALTFDLDDRPGYGFGHVYFLNFTGVRIPGTYRLVADGEVSGEFLIGVEESLLDMAQDSLYFLWVNQANIEVEGWHGESHTQDAIVDGEPKDLTGGWYDAGDYIKFTKQIAETTLWLLLSKLWYGDLLDGNHGMALAEWDLGDLVDYMIGRGLDYLVKTVDAVPGRQVVMVGNESDHFQGVRMPEDDTLNPREGLLNRPGEGGNVMGLSSAVFSLAAMLNQSGSFDPVRYATHLFEMAAKQPEPHNNFAYSEVTSTDELALAGILLFEATGNMSYLKLGQDYLVAYDDEDFLSPAAALSQIFSGELSSVRGVLGWHSSVAESDSFGYIWDEYFWGNLPRALEVGVYSLRIGDGDLAGYAWGHATGVNPWGYSMVTGYGETYPTIHHHQMEKLTGNTLTGALSLGGTSSTVLEENSLPNPGGEFQSEKASFYPTFESYVNNEPTIYTNAILLLFCLALVDGASST